MIDVTPATDSDSQVTVGDKVKLRWLLDVQVNAADITLTVEGASTSTYSGSDLTETQTKINGNTFYRYAREITLDAQVTQLEWALDDGVNNAVDTGFISAQNRLT